MSTARPEAGCVGGITGIGQPSDGSSCAARYFLTSPQMTLTPSLHRAPYTLSV